MRWKNAEQNVNFMPLGCQPAVHFQLTHVRIDGVAAVVLRVLD